MQLETGRQRSIKKHSLHPMSLRGGPTPKKNLSVLNEFHGNCSLGNLRGMGAGRETGWDRDKMTEPAGI